VINFRFHVVAITSVFLALALGLVLGTAALNGPGLDPRSGDLRAANTELRGQVSDLDRQVQGRDGFVEQVGPVLLAGRLTGKQVLVVALPGAAADHLKGVQGTLQQAGATVTGTVGFTDAFVDPTRSNDAVDLATRLVPPGITGLPSNNNGAETAGALFGRVFALGKGTVTDESRTAILAGFTQLKLVEAATPVAPADAVVIVAGPPATGRDADRRNANTLTLVSQFAASFDRAVVAGPTAAGGGNVVGAVRGDNALAPRISTVDTVGSVEGQLAAAMAVAERYLGKAGHYGSGAGATAPVPTLPK
jgi:hypothetical protein